jgi:hypothetical protein
MEMTHAGWFCKRRCAYVVHCAMNGMDRSDALVRMCCRLSMTATRRVKNGWTHWLPKSAEVFRLIHLCASMVTLRLTTL